MSVRLSDRPAVEAAGGDSSPGFRPLYRQVYDYVLRQLTEGTWKAGEPLPSEQALAAQLKVSQGTVRKALDALAAEQVLDRQQGKGTFVAEHTQERATYRFFRLRPADGSPRGTPLSRDDTVHTRPAAEREATRLNLPPSAAVYDIRRTRTIDGRPLVYEQVIVPVDRFPGLDRHEPLPAALYEVYQQQYATTIGAVDEELRADAAGPEDAERLEIEEGAPVLVIDRVARALDGAPVEIRVSRCDTRRYVYASALR